MTEIKNVNAQVKASFSQHKEPPIRDKTGFPQRINPNNNYRELRDEIALKRIRGTTTSFPEFLAVSRLLYQKDPSRPFNISNAPDQQNIAQKFKIGRNVFNACEMGKALPNKHNFNILKKKLFPNNLAMQARMEGLFVVNKLCDLYANRGEVKKFKKIFLEMPNIYWQETLSLFMAQDKTQWETDWQKRHTGTKEAPIPDWRSGVLPIKTKGELMFVLRNLFVGSQEKLDEVSTQVDISSSETGHVNIPAIWKKFKDFLQKPEIKAQFERNFPANLSSFSLDDVMKRFDELDIGEVNHSDFPRPPQY